MANASFKEYMLDALAGIPGLRARAMFGGYGIYSGEVFFGLIAEGVTYFRVDDETRPQYEQRGSKPFVYSRDGKSMTMSYYEVPDDLLEDHQTLVTWAEAAIGAARKAKGAKASKTGKKPRAAKSGRINRT